MTGVFSINYMVSLMIGWGLDYVVVMDRDDNSDKEYKKLTEELNVPENKIFRIEGGKAIEDLFSDKDFKKFILEDDSATLGTGSRADLIKSQKTVFSKRFFEKYKDSTLTLESETKTKFVA